MTLLHELIDIPETLHKSDFVLQLTRGIDAEHRRETLDKYVVTPALEQNFDQALDYVRKATESGNSSATYLDGSFGSGKSHFMAVLHLLLQHDADARSKPELASAVAKHDGWLKGRKFLLVPFHMMGAASFRAEVLSGYAEEVRRLHPGAPTPSFFLGETVFENAESMRAEVGDDKFFDKLNADTQPGSSGNSAGDWGTFGADKAAETWNADSYAEARNAAPGTTERQALLSALISSWFSAYDTVLEGNDEAYVDAENGLKLLTAHAKELGYDAVVLFLDELILWLASRVGDRDFVERQIEDIIKLTEAKESYELPLVSFVARQRDLSELVGEHVAGVEKVKFKDRLKHWEGRFSKIQFQDRDLATIAEKRLLKPKNEGARQQIDTAFEQIVQAGELSVWLGRDGDRAQFRRSYPFPPALLQTLVALSSMLQRERTAIKVMMQLLIDRRADLELGAVIPIGDLYDAIALEADPFTDEIRELFDAARRLDRNKLRPLLAREHGLPADEVEDLELSARRGDAEAAERIAPYRRHERLLHTLLLAALAPEVDAFRGLTAGRLVAHNHGSIRSIIPGQEAADTLQLLKKWARELGQLRFGSGDDPTIALKIVGVDTDAILERLEQFDTSGDRQRRLRSLLYEALALPEHDGLGSLRHSFPWRGTKRTCEIAFGNVREMPGSALRSSEADWRIVFDYPFDEGNYTAQDDLARIQTLRREQTDGDVNRTIVWLPSFWTESIQGQLGQLVRVDYVLRGDHLEQYAAHLSAAHRDQARASLESQQSQLRAALREALEEAYGLRSASSDTLQAPLDPEQHLQSMLEGHQAQLPAAASLHDGLSKLTDQLLTHDHPHHPRFPSAITRPALKKTLEALERLRTSGEERVELDKKDRHTVREVVEPLGLGAVHETALVAHSRWNDALDQALSRAVQEGRVESAEQVTVSELRRLLETDGPLGSDDPGLVPDMQDLIVLDFALANQRAVTRQGIPVGGEIGKLPDDAVLLPQNLPEADHWTLARERAEALFGVTVPSVRNASNAATLGSKLAEQTHFAAAVESSRRALAERLEQLGAEADCDRAKATNDAARVLEAIGAANCRNDVERIEALVDVRLESALGAVGTTIKSAEDVSAKLTDVNLWKVLETALQHPAAAEQGLRTKVVDALRRHELAVSLEAELDQAHTIALDLITPAAPGAGEGPETPAPANTERKRKTFASLEAARDFVLALEPEQVEGELTLLWNENTAPRSDRD